MMNLKILIRALIFLEYPICYAAFEIVEEY